ncbi:MAG: proline--tRNA ligase [bacterium]|nr:MAG: proline--tRNA ligase [bacterium]
MRQSEYFFYTLREDPKDAEIISHKLMIRTGFMSQISSGIYNYLPMGNRVILKIENIVREELDAAGAHELTMPMVQPAELWKRSGRWEHYGKELLRMKDRKDGDYVLGPTHEEVITDIAGKFLRSYKQLPQTLYQIQTKFRDEIRPRFGLMRSREFIMKDAYSFDIDDESMTKSYQKMRDAYIKIFDRIGFRYKIVKADSGAIGGSMSEEFMVLADVGEDKIVSCGNCDYAANIEAAASKQIAKNCQDKMLPIETAKTPNCKTIEAVSKFLTVSPETLIKTIMVEADGEPIMVLLAGSDMLSELKLMRKLGAKELVSASEELLLKLGLVAGYMGPVNAPDIRIIADNRIKEMKNTGCGANIEGKHFINVNYERDFKIDDFFDIRNIKDGDSCPEPECGGKLKIMSGIEVGHIFQLNDKYSKSMDAGFLDRSGRRRHFLMGCYGIGIGRIAAAAIEQSHDDYGIIWQTSISPFRTSLLSLGKDNEVFNFAEKLYSKFEEAGIETLYDDRDERAGIKLADSDLIGCPISVIVGKRGIKSGYIEAKIRRTGEKKQYSVDDIDGMIEWIRNYR